MIGDKYKMLQARVASHNASVAAFNYHIRGVRTVDIWKFTTNTKARPDSTLKMAVQGMEHFSLTPANYERGPGRHPGPAWSGSGRPSGRE